MKFTFSQIFEFLLTTVELPALSVYALIKEIRIEYQISVGRYAEMLKWTQIVAAKNI